MLCTSPCQSRPARIASVISFASSSRTKSSLLKTIQRGFPASFSLCCSNSLIITLAFSNGSEPSTGRISITCNNIRQRSRCFKNCVPKPAPSAAPSIIPGISAITKLRCVSKRTTPKLGTNVVNG